MDFVSVEKRSKIMRGVKSKDTRPELRLRSLLHRAGYRFHLHDPRLPGKPDVVLKKYGTAVFVHGCFWHHHPGCPGGRFPSSNSEFWEKKIRRTQERDRENQVRLETAGWQVLIIWECELANEVDLLNRLKPLLTS